ncbi:hypothetical protein FQA39_LY17168 [Lamprigera yunnana]|nr:hypothetical protein FQA39_LY17168 [Lamprigera yunnana]
MKSSAMEVQIVVFFGLCAFALAVHIEPILSQFQDINDKGQYQYGYESAIESKSEHRTPDGRTIGTYSYVDTNNKIQRVKYSAGIEGFQVLTSDTPEARVPRFNALSSQESSHVPGIVGDTPEVVAARNQHFAAHEAALRDIPKVPVHRTFQDFVSTPVLYNYAILQDTPEVLIAKAQHAAAHAEVRKTVPQLPQNNPVPQGQSFPTETFDNFPRQMFTKFAEEIPRSPLGETPEVAAAREAHLAIYAKVKSQLPEENRKPRYTF